MTYEIFPQSLLRCAEGDLEKALLSLSGVVVNITIREDSARFPDDDGDTISVEGHAEWNSLAYDFLVTIAYCEKRRIFFAQLLQIRQKRSKAMSQKNFRLAQTEYALIDVLREKVLKDPDKIFAKSRYSQEKTI